MAVPLIQVDVKVSDGPLVSQRVEAQAKREGFREMGRFHSRQILPRHTNTGAAKRYGYHPRSTKYVKRAKRRYPNWRPFHASGTAARSLREPIEPSATQYGGRLRPRVVLGGDYATRLTGRPRIKKRQIRLSAAQENMLMRAEEIKAMVPEEHVELAEAWHRGYERGIQSRRMVKVGRR